MRACFGISTNGGLVLQDLAFMKLRVEGCVAFDQYSLICVKSTLASFYLRNPFPNSMRTESDIEHIGIKMFSHYIGAESLL